MRVNGTWGGCLGCQNPESRVQSRRQVAMTAEAVDNYGLAVASRCLTNRATRAPCACRCVLSSTPPKIISCRCSRRTSKLPVFCFFCIHIEARPGSPFVRA